MGWWNAIQAEGRILVHEFKYTSQLRTFLQSTAYRCSIFNIIVSSIGLSYTRWSQYYMMNVHTLSKFGCIPSRISIHLQESYVNVSKENMLLALNILETNVVFLFNKIYCCEWWVDLAMGAVRFQFGSVSRQRTTPNWN